MRQVREQRAHHRDAQDVLGRRSSVGVRAQVLVRMLMVQGEMRTARPAVDASRHRVAAPGALDRLHVVGGFGHCWASRSALTRTATFGVPNPVTRSYPRPAESMASAPRVTSWNAAGLAVAAWYSSGLMLPSAEPPFASRYWFIRT